MYKSLTYGLVKRTFDIAASAALLGLTAPFLALISVIVMAESEGSAIYIHERVGRYGKRIGVLKFRSTYHIPLKNYLVHTIHNCFSIGPAGTHI